MLLHREKEQGYVSSADAEEVIELLDERHNLRALPGHGYRGGLERVLAVPATHRGPAHRSFEGAKVSQPADAILSSVRVSVVIPTLNEAKNLPYVFERMPAGVAQVILVDGNSADETVAIAKRLWPEIVVIQQNRTGKGNALSCGFWAAAGDVIVMLDADGSNDPAEIPRFVAALLAGADFAKGTRFVAGGGSADITRLRRAGNWCLAKAVNVLWGEQYSDLCYGYLAFWRRHLPFLAPDCDGFEVETLINVRATRAGLQVHEVPSFEHKRAHGVSNLNARRDGVRVLRTILAERLRP